MTIVTFSGTARQTLAAGVVDLATGDVRFPFPHPALSARLIGSDDQPYPDVCGSLELREAISASSGAAVSAGEVIVTPGARAAVFLTLLRAAGREVLLPTPRWGSYPALATLAGARPVSYGPVPDLTALDTSRTASTAMVVINSPRNPDGAVVDADVLADVVDWAAQHEITVLFDQVYRAISTVPAPTPLDNPALPEHVVIVDGLTKSHAAAGIRLGWAISARYHHDLAAAASHLIGGVSRLTQLAGVAALRGPEVPRAAALKALAVQTRAAAARLDAIPGIRCPVPDAGFFLFPDIRDAPQFRNRSGGDTPTDIAAWLRDEHAVAVVDGQAFGVAGHLRLSTAVDPTTLSTGLDRLTTALT